MKKFHNLSTQLEIQYFVLFKENLLKENRECEKFARFFLSGILMRSLNILGFGY